MADSRVEQVTVYASGARVRRIARVPAPLPARVTLDDLPLALIDDSVRVEVEGPAIAATVRVAIATPDAEAAPEQPADLAAARQRSLSADRTVAQLERELAILSGVQVVAADPGDTPAPWLDAANARKMLVFARNARELALRRSLIDATREARDAERALTVIDEREVRASSARAAKQHELRKRIELELADVGSGDLVVRVDYRVAAARWAPSYVARLDGDQAIIEVRAVVAQQTGEDWLGATLRLSTASPDQFAVLPELAPQKIGRRQPEPVKRGFRPAPAGADALYADYLHVARPVTVPPIHALEDDGDTLSGAAPYPEKKRAITQEVWDEESSRSKEAFRTPADGMPAFGGAPAPVRGALQRQSPAPQSKTVFDKPYASAPPPPPKAPAPASPVPRLDYGNLRMAPPSSPERGRLVPAASPLAVAIEAEVGAIADRLAALDLPTGCHAGWAQTYDYAFVADGAVDVASDGTWHALAITAKPATVTLRHVAVPREQAAAFRVAAIANPHAAPLLPGPIDVYDRGTFLVTSHVDTTPPSAPIEIGLGVDPAVKIARNVEYHEEATGMLRGALRLVHAIAIDVANHSPRAIELEVRERVPVVRDGDDSAEVSIARVEPAWERWTPDPDLPADEHLRGGHRWRLQVPAGGSRQLRAAYEVRMASKLELVGGNRREP